MSLHSVPEENGNGNGSSGDGDGDDPNRKMISDLEEWADEMMGLSEKMRQAAVRLRQGGDSE